MNAEWNVRVGTFQYQLVFTTTQIHVNSSYLTVEVPKVDERATHITDFCIRMLSDLPILHVHVVYRSKQCRVCLCVQSDWISWPFYYFIWITHTVNCQCQGVFFTSFAPLLDKFRYEYILTTVIWQKQDTIRHYIGICFIVKSVSLWLFVSSNIFPILPWTIRDPWQWLLSVHDGLGINDWQHSIITGSLWPLWLQHITDMLWSFISKLHFSLITQSVIYKVDPMDFR